MTDFKLYNTKSKYSEFPPEIGDYVTIHFPQVKYRERAINIPDTISGFVKSTDIRENDTESLLLYSIDLLVVVFLNDYYDNGNNHSVIPVTIKMQNDFGVSISKEIKKKS